jgi:hypothetical protein
MRLPKQHRGRRRHAHDLHRYPSETRRAWCGLTVPLTHLHQDSKAVDCRICLGMLEHGGSRWIYGTRDTPGQATIRSSR